MKLTVRVTPHASQDESASREAGVLRVRIRASAHDGKANEALLRFLAKEFAVAPTTLRIVRGATARTKIIEIPD